MIVTTGSREFDDPTGAFEKIEGVLQQLTPGTVVVQGGAAGADRMVKLACRLHVIECRTVAARWHDHIDCRCRDTSFGSTCRYAGARRNRQMLDLRPERVVGFWNGRSRGTADCLDEARRRGLTVHVHLL